MGIRFDLALTERGLCDTRSKAKMEILQGHAAINGVICTKPAADVSENDVLALTEVLPYVGRGGLKLAYAIEQFGLSLQGMHCLDIGASTGGFTDCMLQNGAAHVLAVDVGHDQLAEVLRNDPRVTVMEGTDIRTLPPNENGLPADFVSCDVSFISLTHILPLLPERMQPNAKAVLLVKPQFEAGKQALNKHGVVRDPKIHARVLKEIRTAAEAVGLHPLGDCPSPIPGGSGNTEFLLLLEKI
ncbi:MAG: TlyA family RNA methyltransferase [Ruminococcus sp.]|nr:TlyA family RNA methyltransferase [Ruminococcus sp.]